MSATRFHTHTLSFYYYYYKKSKCVKHGEPSHKHCCLRHVGWEGALDKNVPLLCRFKSFRMWHCIFWGWVVPNISKNCPHDSFTLQNAWNSIRLLWEPQILYFHIAFVRLKRVSQVHIYIQTWTGGRRKLCLSSVTLDILNNHKKHSVEFCRVFLGKTVIQQVKIFTASNLKDHNKS